MRRRGCCGPSRPVAPDVFGTRGQVGGPRPRSRRQDVERGPALLYGTWARPARACYSAMTLPLMSIATPTAEVHVLPRAVAAARPAGALHVSWAGPKRTTCTTRIRRERRCDPEHPRHGRRRHRRGRRAPRREARSPGAETSRGTPHAAETARKRAVCMMALAPSRRSHTATASPWPSMATSWRRHRLTVQRHRGWRRAPEVAVPAEEDAACAMASHSAF